MVLGLNLPMNAHSVQPASHQTERRFMKHKGLLRSWRCLICRNQDTMQIKYVLILSYIRITYIVMSVWNIATKAVLKNITFFPFWENVTKAAGGLWFEHGEKSHLQGSCFLQSLKCSVKMENRDNSIRETVCCRVLRLSSWRTHNN